MARAMAMAARWRQRRLSFALFVLVLSSLFPLVRSSCVVGDSTGFPECAGFGQCLQLNLTDQGQGQADTRCLCKPQRYERDGGASMFATDPTCVSSLSAAAPALFSGGRAMLGLLLACTGLLVLAPLVRLCCFTRPAARDTRFERITVASADLLRPTPGQLKHARLALSIASAAVLLWIIDVAADPFGGESTLNDLGGYTLRLGSDGRAIESGMKLRELLEDLSELCLFICYAFFFILFRKVVVPAPALLSGDRFMKDWSASDHENKGTSREHNVYLRASIERASIEAGREALEAQRLADGLPVDTHEEREQRWLSEQQSALRSLHEELAASDIQAAQQRQADRRQTMQRQHTVKFTRTSKERAATLRGDNNKHLPPPPPPLPPQVPAPSAVPAEKPGKSASKYVVAEGAAELADAPIVAPSGPPASSAVAAAWPHVFALDFGSIKPAATGTTDQPDSDAEDENGDSPSHSIRIDPSAAAEVAALQRTLAEMESKQPEMESRASTARGAGGVRGAAEEGEDEEDQTEPASTLPADASVEVSPADLLDYPVPDYLVATFLLQFLCTFLLLLALPLAHAVFRERLVFTATLWLCYLALHLAYLWYLLSFWSPFYLISLREDILAEAGIPLPRHRRVTPGTGAGVGGGGPSSASSASGSTLHFGLRTAYELSKLHSLYLYCLLGTVLLAFLHACLMIFQSYAHSPLNRGEQTPHADSTIVLFMFVRLVQCVRVAGVVVVFYPFQIVIQYQTLQNFWLDGKLHVRWGQLFGKRAEKTGHKAGSRADAQAELVERYQEQALAVRPQLAGSDVEEEEKERAAAAAAAAEVAAGPVLLRPSAAQSGPVPATSVAGSLAVAAEAETTLSPAASALAHALSQRGWFPLYIRTTFRPIPTADELLAVKEAAARPKLLADLKRLRTMDRAQLRASGKLASTRLWRAGARHHRIFFEESPEAAALGRAKEHGQRLEQDIAHSQFVLWREQQLRNPSPMMLRQAAAAEAAEAEKIKMAASAKEKEAAAVAAAAAADPFSPFQKLYGDPTGELAVAARRHLAELVRGGDKRSRAEEVAEEFRKLNAIRERMRTAQNRSLPPLQARSAASVPPPLPGMGVRKKAVLQPLQQRPAVTGASAEKSADVLISAAPRRAPIAVESSHSVSSADASGLASPSGSGANHSLLPGSVTADGDRSGGDGPATRDERALLNDEDDFVSESRSLHSVQTPRDRNMYLLTPR